MSYSSNFDDFSKKDETLQGFSSLEDALKFLLTKNMPPAAPEKVKPNCITATYLLAMPRTGSYALSVLFDTPHCIAHHEGEDFGVIANFSESSYAKTYSYSQLALAMRDGKNYFCGDQSCGVFLLQMALRHKQVQEWIVNGYLRVQILVMMREPAESCHSLIKKADHCGLYPAASSVFDACTWYRQIIMDSLTTGMSLLKHYRVWGIIPPLGYEGATEPEVLVLEGDQKVKVRTRTFTREFLSSTMACIGVCGKAMDRINIPREEEAFKAMVRDEYPSINMDREMLRSILSKNEEGNMDQSDWRFKENYKKLQTVLEGCKPE